MCDLKEKYNNKTIKSIDLGNATIKAGLGYMIDRIEYWYEYCGEYSIPWAICYLDGNEVERINLSRVVSFEWE